MVAQQQFQNGATGIERTHGICENFNAIVVDWGCTGRNKNAAWTTDASGFYQADAAGSRFVGNTATQILAIAQGRNVDIQFLGGFKDGGACRNGNLLAVNCNGYFAHVCHRIIP